MNSSTQSADICRQQIETLHQSKKLKINIFNMSSMTIALKSYISKNHHVQQDFWSIFTSKSLFLQRFSPADRAGLEKMDYVWTVNGKEVICKSIFTITMHHSPFTMHHSYSSLLLASLSNCTYLVSLSN